jgi:hypothetical protein
MDRTENTVHHCCSSTAAVGTCLFVKPLLSNDSCVYAYLAIVDQQWVYILHCSLLKTIHPRQPISLPPFLFREGRACDVSDGSCLPFLWLGSHSDYSPTATSLRLFILSGSLIRCQLIQVYHHPSFWLVWANFPRVINAPTSLALKLLVVFPSVWVVADSSTMS